MRAAAVSWKKGRRGRSPTPLLLPFVTGGKEHVKMQHDSWRGKGFPLACGTDISKMCVCGFVPCFSWSLAGRLPWLFPGLGSGRGPLATFPLQYRETTRWPWSFSDSRCFAPSLQLALLGSGRVGVDRAGREIVETQSECVLPLPHGDFCNIPQSGCPVSAWESQKVPELTPPKAEAAILSSGR